MASDHMLYTHLSTTWALYSDYWELLIQLLLTSQCDL